MPEEVEPPATDVAQPAKPNAGVAEDRLSQEVEPPATDSAQPAQPNDGVAAEYRLSEEVEPPATDLAQPAQPSTGVAAEDRLSEEVEPPATDSAQPTQPNAWVAAEGRAPELPVQVMEQQRPEFSLAAERPAAGSAVRLRLPSKPPELQFLTFFSWWTEFNTKRYVEVCFDMSTELFQIILDRDVKHLDKDHIYCPAKESFGAVVGKDTQIMSMHLPRSRSGSREHLSCWDLHVGARLNILGRPTTLMQADLQTGQWLDYHSTKLATIAHAYEEQLRKYESDRVIAKLSSKGPRAAGGERPVPGSVDLRRLLDHVQILHERLSRYRPSVAAEIMQYM